MSANRLRQGHHCGWDGGSNARGFFYIQQDTNTEYNAPIFRNFLESLPLDRNFWNEADPKPVALWWTIELDGFEIVQQPDFNGGESGQFAAPYKKWEGTNNLTAPGPQFANRHTHLKARVNYMNNASWVRYVDIDIGPGMRVSVQSDQAFVQLLGPPATRLIAEGAGTPNSFPVPNPVPDDVAFTQALVVGRMSLSPFAPLGERVATNTIVQNVAANLAGQLMKIPPAATQVTLYQGLVGDVDPVLWIPGARRGPGDTFDIMPAIGQLFIDPVTRRSPRCDVPKHATHLSFANLDDVDRIYTAVWELEF